VLYGNVLYVDAVNGNNATAQVGRLDLPFLTITAAIAVATSGAVIFLRPGTYASESFPINIPTNVSLIGQSADSCIISTTATVTTTMISAAAGVELRFFTLSMTSSTSGLTLTGISSSVNWFTTYYSDLIINITTTSTGLATIYGLLFQHNQQTTVANMTCNNILMALTASSLTSGSVNGVYHITTLVTQSVRIRNCSFALNTANLGAAKCQALFANNGTIFAYNCAFSNTNSNSTEYAVRGRAWSTFSPAQTAAAPRSSRLPPTRSLSALPL
jgi:hypothetical protein